MVQSVCPAKTEGLVRYPTTLAPPTNTVTVTTQCAENAHIVSSQPVLCHPSGDWSGVPECECDGGYQSATYERVEICQTGGMYETLKNVATHFIRLLF